MQNLLALQNARNVDHCEPGSGLLNIPERMRRNIALTFKTGKSTAEFASIAIWSGAELVAAGQEELERYVVGERLITKRVVEIITRLKAYQRYMVVIRQAAERFAQGDAWRGVVTKTGALFDLLGVPTCDGTSLTRTMANHRVWSAKGYSSKWCCGYNDASKRSLAEELGNTFHVESLVPRTKEMEKGGQEHRRQNHRAEGAAHPEGRDSELAGTRNGQGGRNHGPRCGTTRRC